ncbi:putative transmembrane protein [Rhodanobacter sp. 115]|nr:putative transmembrane protein [Rhodanobacter sp. 115]
MSPAFAPWAALGGGMLIGLASLLLLVTVGRIAGVSGIAAGLLPPRLGDIGWRLAFVLGLPAGAAVWALGVGGLSVASHAAPCASSWPGCWWVSAPALARGVPVAMACVDSVAVRRARWRPCSCSWRSPC